MSEVIRGEALKILMIAYYFPPDSSSGSFRPFHFANHLEEMGENVYVLTACEEDYLPYQPKDYNQLKNINKNIKIIRCGLLRPREAVIKYRDLLIKQKKEIKNNSIYNDNTICLKPSLIKQVKDTFTDFLSTPDPHIGWLPSAVKKGKEIIKEKNIDLIYATGSPWTSLIIGAFLKKLTRKPLVMDFRDPWTANPGFMIRSKVVRFVETFMERKVILSADRIITNTDELKQNFLIRFPNLTDKTVSTVANGFEIYIGDTGNINDKFTITHAGSLYFSRNPKFFIQAVFNLIEKGKIPDDKINIVFLGGIAVQDSELEKLLNHPILQNVIKLLRRLPYEESLRYQSKSDVLFLIQPNFPLQIPRKLYDYMAFRKPILGITDVNGATARVIREKRLGFVTPDKVTDIESVVEFLYRQWKNGIIYNNMNRITCDDFLNKNLTIQLLKIFKECKGT